MVRIVLRPFDVYRLMHSFIIPYEGEVCWTWMAALYWSGYGVFYANGRGYKAHRAVYETLIGSVPNGLVLDHLCRNRACVNPAHLEPVTNAENIARGVRPSFNRKRITTICSKGHQLTEENTYYTPKNPTSKQCRVCRRNSKSEWDRKRKLDNDRIHKHSTDD